MLYEKRNNFSVFPVDSVRQEIKNWIIIFFVYYSIEAVVFPQKVSKGKVLKIIAED